MRFTASPLPLSVYRITVHGSEEAARETLIKSLPEIILEFLCKTRKSDPRIASYLRIALTKYCVKIRMISGSSI